MGLTLSTACSSDDGAKGPSGLVSSRAISELSATEASALCDWSLATEGGPGKVTDCGGGNSRVVHTKEECLEDHALISKLSSCVTVTVSDIERCAIESGKDACGDHPECKALNARLDTCAGKD
ncbi:MAG TPA: hypothetical protein VM925_15690 [Labilithrix sp.]|nr:hypothetical protein [Labilithrix sp.]